MHIKNEIVQKYPVGMVLLGAHSADLNKATNTWRHGKWSVDRFTGLHCLKIY